MIIVIGLILLFRYSFIVTKGKVLIMNGCAKESRTVTPEELIILDKIKKITDCGNDAEVRKKKDGTWAVYEISKKYVK